MKASPPPPSYSVAMEQQQNQVTPTAENVEPPTYQETNGTGDDIIQPINNDTAPQQQQPNAQRVS